MARVPGVLQRETSSTTTRRVKVKKQHTILLILDAGRSPIIAAALSSPTAKAVAQY